MFGFGVSLNQVFASRWKALVWSLGILLTAYCSVPERETQADKAQDTQVIVVPDLVPEQPSMD